MFIQGKRKEGSDKAVFYVSFVAGFAAGCFSALIVTPLDGMELVFSHY